MNEIAGQPEGVGQQQGRKWRPGDPCPKCGAQNSDNRVDLCTTASGRDHKARWAGPVSQRRSTCTSTPAPSPTPPARDSGREVPLGFPCGTCGGRGGVHRPFCARYSAPSPTPLARNGGRLALACPECGEGVMVRQPDPRGDYGEPIVGGIECQSCDAVWDNEGEPA